MNRIKEPRSSIWVGVGRDRTGGADQPAWALPRFPCAVLTARRTWLLPWEARSLELNESGKGLILAYRESTNLHSISPAADLVLMLSFSHSVAYLLLRSFRHIARRSRPRQSLRRLHPLRRKLEGRARTALHQAFLRRRTQASWRQHSAKQGTQQKQGHTGL